MTPYDCVKRSFVRMHYFPKSDQAERAVDKRVKLVVEVLEQRFNSSVRVAELADQVGLGASRLEHLFKQEARVSIRDFIRERRLAAAAQLLAGSIERVSVISFRVGFQHVANFNHAFKKRFGVTPREFRARRDDNGTGPDPRAFDPSDLIVAEHDSTEAARTTRDQTPFKARRPEPMDTGPRRNTETPRNQEKHGGLTPTA